MRGRLLTQVQHVLWAGPTGYLAASCSSEDPTGQLAATCSSEDPTGQLMASCLSKEWPETKAGVGPGGREEGRLHSEPGGMGEA